MIRIIRSSFVCLVATLLFAIPLAAQKNATPVINSAIADGATLFIAGSGFGNAPTVTLGGFFLGGVTVDPLGAAIQATLPAMQPGSYQLQVINSNRICVFEVTIGAAGPVGPSGADGATGPTGLTGLQGVMGINGATGATGPVGPTGPQGTSGILSVHGFSGDTGTISPNAAYQFVGPQATVTTAGAQRLTGAATVALGLASGELPVFIPYGLCYQPNAGGALTNFAGGNYVLGRFPASPERLNYSATATTSPGAGAWRVGFCLQTPYATLDNNDFVNGWVIVSQ
jgi:hypothetical protein